MKHIDFARQFLGLKEQNGELPNITQWANEMKVKGVNASYAWCAIFLNYVLFRTGYESMIQANGGAKQGLNVASSRDFWKVGKLLSSPKVGCIVVFSRGNTNAYKGHVGIVSEVISESQIKVISGNDSNAVTERIYTVPNTN